MNIDQFLDREYDCESYNCGHFVVEVYKELTGIDLKNICSAFLSSNLEWYSKELKFRTRLDKPVSPCLAMIKGNWQIPHVGIYIDGKILHLNDQGSSLDPLEVFHNQRIIYYK